jgi:hypothetical protein
MLCESDEPLLAGIANGIASYMWENENDPDGALKAAGRMLAAFDNRGTPWIRAVAHSRIAELCLQVERGDEARRHFRTTLLVLEELEAWPGVMRMRWAMVLANLQLGALDEAEHWLEQMALNRVDEPVGVFSSNLGARAEILLARGEVDTGLRLWRRAVDQLRNPESPIFGIGSPGLEEPWTFEIQAVAVIAHAHHGRLDLVQDITDEMQNKLSGTLTNAVVPPPASPRDFPVCGALLLALAMVDLDRGERTGDARARRSAARMIALAERFCFPRGYQPTMSAARARHVAEHADRSAYADAVSSYADLGRDALRAAALTALRARDSALTD